MKFLVFLVPLILANCTATSSSDTAHASLEAWNTVQSINRHWAITEDMDSLALYLHDDMTLVSPGSMLVGKNAIIDAYRKYNNYARTINFQNSKPRVQLYNHNKTAVVTYRNQLDIKTLNGNEESFLSIDMYTLIFEKGKWLAVSQHYSFIQKE